MIPIKTAKEIESMKEGGRRLAWVLEKVLAEVKPGITTLKLDQLAESLIEKQGGKSSFKMVKNYHWATCININQGVVHGVPNEYRLKEGDLVSLDIGFLYKGLHTDMARTKRVTPPRWPGGTPRMVGRVNKFLSAGQKALKKAIEAAKLGNRVGYISASIEREIKKAGFNPVKVLTGHGVGKKLHEDPQIPCFLKGKRDETPELTSGMTLAIEVIYTQGKPEVVLTPDGWTVKTADGKLAGLFEDTVVVTNKGGEVLTKIK